MSNFLEHQNWRYATKKFDPTKKITTSNLDFLKAAMQLSASSYGLQPYQILIVEDPAVRQQLLAAAYGQSQITDAACIIVFANKTNLNQNDVDQYLQNMSVVRNIALEKLQDYGNFMKAAIQRQSPEESEIWTAKQAYIALANLLHAAAELKIDVTPMEGFDATQFNEILNLTSQNLNATVIAAIGYRHTEDHTQHLAKVRKPTNELFTTI